MRSKRLLIVGAALAVLVAAAGALQAEKAPPQPQPQSHCPVSGEPIDKTVATEYQGQKVYFCCPKCIAAFEKDPEGYLAKLGARGEIVESQQTLCPVSGEEIDPKVSTDYQGRRVFFCCDSCVKKFRADPAKFLPLLGQTGAPAGAGMHQDQTAPKGHENEGDGHGGTTKADTYDS